jgi:hypothetical protein
MSSLLKTTTSVDSPLDASGGDDSKPPVSDFLTVQSLTNFSAMAGAITAAWNAPNFDTRSVRSLDPVRVRGVLGSDISPDIT